MEKEEGSSEGKGWGDEKEGIEAHHPNFMAHL